MSLKITPPKDLTELSAAVEVTKSLSFNALLVAFAGTGGAPPEVFEGLKQNLLAVFKSATSNLPEEEAERFRIYAEAVIEELFSRLIVNGTPMRLLSS